MEILVIVIIIASDLILKAYAEENFVGTTVPFIPGLISLTYLENRGAAFGMMQGGIPFFIVLTIPAFILFFYFLISKRDWPFFLRFALALIIGGTAGNFVDRVKLGYVRDMINFDFMNFPVFNIADSALTVGATLFFICYLFFFKETEKKEKASAEGAEESAKS